MKNKTVIFKVYSFFLTTACLFMTKIMMAQGLQQAAKAADSEISGVVPIIKKICLACAIIFAAVGLVKALSKSNVEEENSGKHYAKWFGGCAIFAIGWLSIQFFFNGK